MPGIRKITAGLLTALLLAGAGLPAADATEIFNRAGPPEGRTPYSFADDVPALSDGAETPARQPQQAPPRTITAFANDYFNTCLKQDHPILRGESLELMCGCTAAQIPQNMTVRQMQAMGENTDEGALQRSRMLLFVYTPCIKYPTKALVESRCLDDPNVRSGMKRYKKVCACLADGMAALMEKEAPGHVEEALKRDSGNLDPLRMLLESRLFTEQSQYHMRRCVTKHEFGGGR